METRTITKRRNRVMPMLLGIVTGSLVGGIATLLAAPRPGIETRHMIMDKGSQLKDQAGDMVGGVRDKAGNMVGTVKDKASDMAGQARTRIQGTVTSMRSRSNDMSQEDMETAHAKKLERDINILEDDIDKTYNL